MNVLRSLELPQAAKWQESVIPFDWTLTQRARDAGLNVRWWWGGRTVDGKFGAYCYHCNRLIETWNRAWPITQRAITAVLSHRDLHLMGRAPTIGSDSPGTSPGVAAQAPTEEQEP